MKIDPLCGVLAPGVFWAISSALLRGLSGINDASGCVFNTETRSARRKTRRRTQESGLAPCFLRAHRVSVLKGSLWLCLNPGRSPVSHQMKVDPSRPPLLWKLPATPVFSARAPSLRPQNPRTFATVPNTAELGIGLSQRDLRVSASSALNGKPPLLPASRGGRDKFPHQMKVENVGPRCSAMNAELPAGDEVDFQASVSWPGSYSSLRAQRKTRRDAETTAWGIKNRLKRNTN